MLHCNLISVILTIILSLLTRLLSHVSSLLHLLASYECADYGSRSGYPSLRERFSNTAPMHKPDMNAPLAFNSRSMTKLGLNPLSFLKTEVRHLEHFDG